MSHAYVSHVYKFVYFACNKVASTSLIVWFYKIHGIRDDMFNIDLDDDNGVEKIDKSRQYHFLPRTMDHQKCLDFFGFEYYSIKNYSQKITEEPDWTKDYFKFIFLRNPYDRLVSTFIDKFCRNNDQAVTNQVYNLYKRNPSEGLTFEAYVNFHYKAFINNQTYKIDIHTRPILKCIPQNCLSIIDKIYTIENFDQAINEIYNKINLEDEKKSIMQKHNVNHTKDIYEDYNVNLHPSQINSNIIKENKVLWSVYDKFYTPILKQIITKIYKDDLEYYKN